MVQGVVITQERARVIRGDGKETLWMEPVSRVAQKHDVYTQMLKITLLIPCVIPTPVGNYGPAYHLVQ